MKDRGQSVLSVVGGFIGVSRGFNRVIKMREL